MSMPLRALLIEDSEDDAELLLLELRRGGFEVEFERVETAETLRASLSAREWDIVLSDFHLPRFSAPDALKIIRDLELDLPFIVLSGVINTEEAVTLMRAGANDFARKDDLARIAPAVKRELAETESRRKRRDTEKALRQSEQRLSAAQTIANLGNWQFDVQTKELWWSDEMYRILGHEPQAFAPSFDRLLESVHPGDQEVLREAIDRAAKSGKIFSFDHRIILPGGQNRVVHERAEVIYDEKDVVTAVIQDVTTDPEDAALTRAIIAMAHGLGLSVIGEGVETVEQLEFLRAEGCNMVQGYFISRPMDPEAFYGHLRTGHEFGAVIRKPVDSLA